MNRLEISQYFTMGGLILGSAEMARNQSPALSVTAANQEFFIRNLDVLLWEAEKHGMKRTLTNAKQAKDYFETYKSYSGKPNYGDVHLLFQSANQAAIDDLNEMLVTYIDADRAAYFNNASAVLDVAVFMEFPQISHDVAEAGNCYAAGRNSACVFHLMRIMEYGVQRFGKKLKVPLSKVSVAKLHEYTWHQILDLMNPEIAKIPQTSKAGKAKHQRFSAIQAELYRVKDAWRNPTMHPSRDPYSSLETLNIMSHVRAFMSELLRVIV